MCLSCFGLLGFQGAPVPNPSVFKVLTPKISKIWGSVFQDLSFFRGSIFGAFLGLLFHAFWAPFGLLGAALGALWAALGTPWAALGTPWAALGPLLGAIGVSWEPFWHPLGSFWGRKWSHVCLLCSQRPPQIDF